MTTAVPSPTGRFAVGRTVREWTDPTRVDPYAADPAEPRSLVTWIWYPRGPSTDEPVADYLPAAWQPTLQLLGIRTTGLASHSADGAAMADDEAAYPVVLLSPSGFPPLLLSGTAEELASQGFVVVGINHTYETTVTVFADGRTAAMNPAAIAGALGPQAGAHQEVFDRRGGMSIQGGGLGVRRRLPGRSRSRRSIRRPPRPTSAGRGGSLIRGRSRPAMVPG
jgi:hypothetical protein